MANDPIVDPANDPKAGGGTDPNNGGKDPNDAGDKGNEGADSWKKEKQGILAELRELRELKKGFLTEKEKKEQEELEKGKKYEEILVKKDQKIAELENQFKLGEKKSLVKDLASKAGAVDPSDIYALISGTIDEADEAKISEAIEQVKKDKPYLFGKVNNNIGGGSTPGNPNGKPIFTREQLRDTKFYQANRKEILEAIRENRIKG